ncbi:MAG: hypothetical protein ACREDE_02185, partial [Thermoplasmata archaeon]
MDHPPAAYSVTYSESGLPDGTSWAPTFAGLAESTNDGSLSFAEVNGSWSYSVAAPLGYLASPSSGVVRETGASQTVLLSFSSRAYSLTFTESGLPRGTSWSVDLNGTTNSSMGATIGFFEPNGTYPFTVIPVSPYTAEPSSGSLAVRGGPVQDEPIVFSIAKRTLFPVNFTETGLPSGTSWYVSFAGVKNASTTDRVGFLSENGTFSYAVGAVSGYTAIPSSGMLHVDGGGVSVAVAFSVAPTPIPTYRVAFTETGLTTGTTWSVTLNGTTTSSALESIGFTEPNGSYPFRVGPLTGYASTTAAGASTITVHGANVS